MHSHLAAGVPGGARLLKPPPSLDRDGKGSAAGRLRLAPDLPTKIIPC